jgi:hypothetical protein
MCGPVVLEFGCGHNEVTKQHVFCNSYGTIHEHEHDGEKRYCGKYCSSCARKNGTLVVSNEGAADGGKGKA